MNYEDRVTKEYVEGLLVNAGMPKIATGSYTGTGRYGAGNPNSLSFDFEPKMLIVMVEDSPLEFGVFFRGAATIGRPYTQGKATVTWNGGTVSWYHPTYVSDQLNNTSRYYYIAFG